VKEPLPDLRGSNHESLADNYDAWFALLLAICASVGRDMAYFTEIVLPWLLLYPKNTQEDMEAKWQSCKTSSLGPDYVYRIARQFGCKEAEEAINKHHGNLALSLYATGDEETPEAAPDDGAVDGGGGSSGPRPSDFTDTALRDSFIAKDLGFYRIKEHRDPTKAWVRRQDGLMVPSHSEFAQAVSDHCSASIARLIRSHTSCPSRSPRSNMRNERRGGRDLVDHLLAVAGGSTFRQSASARVRGTGSRGCRGAGPATWIRESASSAPIRLVSNAA
jgi:hypothetical protein